MPYLGNPLNYRDGITLTWKNGRQLASSTVGTIETTYNYDISGNRVYRAGGGFRHTYRVIDGVTLGEKIVFVGNGTTHYMEYMRDENGEVYGFIYDGSTYFLEKNALGDVKYLLNGSGSVVAKYTYDAWGKVVSVTDASGNAITDWANVAHLNPFRYRSYYYDFESGLYYLKSRYYDPVLCRFVNADNEMSGVSGDTLGYNLFAYCFNNPVNMSDPSGNWPKWVSGALNIVSGVAQIAAGVALGTFAGWTGIGAVAAGVLVVNGAATMTQGIGQIVNDVTSSNTLREDNIVRTAVKDVGGELGGDAGAEIAASAYDAIVIASGVYAGTVYLDKSMPKIVKSKAFSYKDGYGFKIGKSIEMMYRNPNAEGGPGGTFFSYKGLFGKFRIDWDPANGFHSHPPGH